MKRSVDNGTSWSKLQVVHSASTPSHHVTIGNPAPVYNSIKKQVVLLFCQDNNDVFVTRSSDVGRSWTEPVNITAAVKGPSWSWIATGPPGGIQLKSGRLVVCSDHILDSKPFSSAMFSDDGGYTWQQSTFVAGGNECQVALAPNGSLIMSMRTAQSFRQFSFSNNEGGSWSAPTHESQHIDGKAHKLLPHARPPPHLVLPGMSRK